MLDTADNITHCRAAAENVTDALRAFQKRMVLRGIGSLAGVYAVRARNGSRPASRVLAVAAYPQRAS